MARSGARSDTGRKREGNEDRYIAREERGVALLAVADGVGGSSGGEVAADAALAALASRFFAAPADRPAADALAEAVRDANAAVLSAARSSGHPDAASTLVAAAVRGTDAVIANLGDSRAYLIRDGECRQLTQDHSGVMPHSISRFVGDPRGVQPDVFVEALRPGDRLLLCSDGLTRHVSEDEIAATIRGRSPQTAADALVDLANERGGEDNVTVVLYAPARAGVLATPRRRAAAFAAFVAVVVLVAAGTIAALFSLLPSAPAATPTPAPTASPSPSPTTTVTPTPTPTQTRTEAPTPTATP